MRKSKLNQTTKSDKNVFTATGNVYIYNYSAPSASTDEPAQLSEQLSPCPYRGLFAFGPDYANLFFGRESVVNNLFDIVQKQRFTALIGASGSGKSSVVLAGLVPRLHRTSQCLLTHFRPTDDPYLSLARALLPLYDPDLTKTDQISESKKLAQNIRAGDVLLKDIVSLVLGLHPAHHIFIIADQFEELFTLSQRTTDHRQFVDFLLSGLSHCPNEVSLIVILRADFLNQASLYRPLADAMQGATQILGPMTRAELTQAIESPAKLLKVSFEDGLVDRILSDVGKEAGSLPLLEFALTELWGLQQNSVLTHSAYNSIGQVGGALGRYADEVFHLLSDDEKGVARSIFIQLVKPGLGTEDTRRLANSSELEADKWSLVTKLATND